MSGKVILLIICLVILFYPGYTIYQLEQAIHLQNSPALAQNRLINFQISIWIVWVMLLCSAIFTKWVKKSNFTFYFTYGFVVVAFAVFGFYAQEVINDFNLSSPFKDDYSHGVFAAVQNIVTACALTAVLQAAVWWFTRRWHRR